MGLGEGKADVKSVDHLREDLYAIAGQAPVACRAKKSIAGFKIRKGQNIGLKVTLRRARMWEFLDRLTSVALPRIRDFRGLDPKAFDANGSYNLGLREHHIFPEVNLEKSPRSHGLNVTFGLTRALPVRAQAVLELLGLPFRKPGTKGKGN
jgi:large subunit ribosomal protein L5